MNNWKDLDADVRKALLRGEPATDPETDRIAREHATEVLGRSMIRRLRLVVPVAVVCALGLGFATGIAGWPSWIVGVIIFSAGIGCAIVESRRKLALIRILNVSTGTPRAHLSGERVATGRAERLELRMPVGGVLRTVAPLLAAISLALAFAVVASTWWLIVPVIVIAIPVVAYAGHMLWSTLPGNEQILDADGISIPKYGLRLGWDAVREIRMMPLRATAGDRRQVLAFLLHDNQDFLRQLPRWMAVVANLNTKTYLSPLVLLDSVTDRPIDEVAGVAAGLSGLEVTVVPVAS
ncbi:hypothetical protein ACWDOP_09920 [Nocardia sp. NPDC003693]